MRNGSWRYLTALAAALTAVPFVGLAAGSDWVSLGLGQPVQAIAVDPLFPSTIYAASGGAVFRTLDGGASWEEADAGMPPGGLIDKLVATESAVFAEESGWVFRTVDGGRSWAFHKPATSLLNAVAVAVGERGTYFIGRPVCSSIECQSRCFPTGCASIYGADARGVGNRRVAFLSYAIALAPAGTPTTLVAAPGTVERLYAGSSGRIWNSLSGDESVQGVVTVLASASSEVVYAVASNTGVATVLRRDAGGWVAASTGLPPAVRALAVHPSVPETVYAGTSDGVYRSGDGGRSWSPYGLSARVVASLAVDPKDPFTIYAGTAEGIFVRRSASPSASECVANPTTKCLADGRFRVEVVWRTDDGRQGRASGNLVTPNAASFCFFDPNNVELVVKVLDGTSVNGRHWIFAGSLSTVQYEITVTDTRTGAQRHYVNPPGRLSSYADAAAFPETGDPAPPAEAARDAEPYASTAYLGQVAACSPDARDLCLNEGRFQVAVRWETRDGRSGWGEAVPLTADSGYFWFFGASNLELVVKVLDGGSVNGHFWVFSGALSNVAYTITVTDTETGVVKTYENPQGQLASFADTEAF